MNKLILVLAVAFALCAVDVQAGPFGTEMGDGVEKFTELEPIKNQPNAFTTPQMPTTNTDFILYVLIIPKEYGLTFIQANSHIFENDSYGIEAKKFFSSIETVLTKKYGKPKKYDRLFPGSIWKEPKYWLTGIAKNERYYSAFWTFNKPKENIVGISLTVHALNNTNSVVRLTYEYANHKKYLDEIKKKKNESL